MNEQQRAEVFNKEAYWHAYREMAKRANDAIRKFSEDVQRNASPDIIARDHDNLVLILAECDYMVHECSRLENQNKRKR